MATTLTKKKYEAGTTVLKALVVFVVLFVAQLAPLVTVIDAIPGNLDDWAKPAALIAFVGAVFKAICNYQKNTDKRDRRIPFLQWLPIILVCLLVGCATNHQKFEEEVWDGGFLVSKTTYHQKGRVTIGSKQDSAGGTLTYTWNNSNLTMGNDAQGQEAGTGAELVTAVGDVAIKSFGIATDAAIAKGQLQSDTVRHGIDAATEVFGRPALLPPG